MNNKIAQLHHLITTRNPDIIVGNETQLTRDFNSSELFPPVLQYDNRPSRALWRCQQNVNIFLLFFTDHLKLIQTTYTIFNILFHAYRQINTFGSQVILTILTSIGSATSEAPIQIGRRAVNYYTDRHQRRLFVEQDR